MTHNTDPTTVRALVEAPYMPSNGTEGEFFHEAWCYRCALYGDPDEGDVPPCEIQLNALCGIQPAEWIETCEGPKCKAFRIDPAVLALAKAVQSPSVEGEVL